jgi:hypothetical protein
MSFVVAGGVLLFALVVGIIILGETSIRGQQRARRDAPPLDAWWWW